EKVSLDSLLVIRVLLDYAQDVEEAIALLHNYNVYFHGPPLHYLLADASGHSAVVEFVDGDMRVLRNRQPWQVSTNFVVSEAQPQGSDSECWRYNRVYEELKGVEGGLSDEEAVALLKSVSQGNTIWSLVYNLSSGDVRVAMAQKYDQVHLFRLDR
ncbi:MAG: linear amide C-N hydrolase, partial [Anaerolineales bacterium]